MTTNQLNIEAQTQTETSHIEQPAAPVQANSASIIAHMAQNPAPETMDKAALEAQIAQKMRESYAEMAGIAAQAARLGVTLDVGDAMAKGLKPDAVRRAVLEELASRSNATSVIAATAPSATSVDSPIVRRARAAAEKAKA